MKKKTLIAIGVPALAAVICVPVGFSLLNNVSLVDGDASDNVFTISIDGSETVDEHGHFTKTTSSGNTLSFATDATFGSGITLEAGEGIENPFLLDEAAGNKITGITSISVTTSATAYDLDVAFGWEEADLLSKVAVEDGVADLSAYSPSYFWLFNNGDDAVSLSDVTITYTCREGAKNVYALNVVDGYSFSYNGAVSLSQDDVAYDNGSFFLGGSTVTLELTSGSTWYETSEVFGAGEVYITIGDETTAYTYDTTTNPDVWEIDITMPEEDTTIYIDLNEDVVASTATGAFAVNFVDLPEGIKVLNHKPGNYYDAYDVEFGLLREEGWAISSVEIAPAGNTDETAWTTLDEYGVSSFDAENLGIIYCYYANNYRGLSSDTDIRINASYVGSRNISYTGLENVYSTRTDVFPTSATVGDYVYVGNIYAIGNAMLTAITVTGAENTGYLSTTQYYGSFEFTMPDNDVSIEFTTVGNPDVIVTGDDGLESYTISTSAYSINTTNAYYPGSTFYIYPTFVAGYIFDSATMTIDGVETPLTASTNYNGATYISFTMPESEVSIAITTKRVNSVVIEYNEDHVGRITGSYAFDAGDSVSYGVQLTSALYTLDSAHIKDDDSIAVSVSGSGTYFTVSFTMPAKDVTLVLVTSAVPTYSIAATSNEFIQSFSFYQSGSGLDIDVTSPSYSGTLTNVLPGSLSISSIVPVSGYKPVITVTYSDDTPDLVTDANFSTWSNNYNAYVDITDKVESIAINGVEIVPVTISVRNETSLDDDAITLNGFTYNSTSGEAESVEMTAVYPNVYFKAEIANVAPDGVGYSISYEDASGNSIRTSYQGGTANWISVTGNFTIVVSEYQAYNFSLVNDDFSADSVTISLVDSSYSNYYAPGEKVPGTFYIYGIQINVSGATSGFNYTMTMGGVAQTWASGTATSSYAWVQSSTGTVQVTGDIVITITAPAA